VNLYLLQGGCVFTFGPTHERYWPSLAIPVAVFSMDTEGAPFTAKQQAWLRSMFQSQSTLPSPLPGSSGTVPPTSVAAPPVSLATVNTSGELTYVCIGVCTNPSRGQLQHRPRGTGSPAGTGAYGNYTGHGLPTARPIHGRTARSNFGPRWGTSRRPGVWPRRPAIRLAETGYQSHW